MASAAVHLEGQAWEQAFSRPGSLGQSRNILILTRGASRKRSGCFPKGLHVLYPPALVGPCFPHPLASPPHSPFGCSHARRCDMTFVFSYIDFTYFLCYPPLRMFSMDFIFKIFEGFWRDVTPTSGATWRGLAVVLACMSLMATGGRIPDINTVKHPRTEVAF